MNPELTLDELLTEMPPDFSFQEASDKLKEKLASPDPCMIARLGGYELECVKQYRQLTDKAFKRFCKRMLYPGYRDWEENFLRAMSHSTGFFPTRPALVEKFAALMIDDMKQVDILGSWLKDEMYFSNELAGAVRVHFTDLEPYCHTDPWSEVLTGKRVLVVHPFEESIRKQYAIRHLLFQDRRVLPDFELITLKAVQSICDIGPESGFRDWFEALEFMKQKISAVDFDIALIGCGAYGFPLAAHVKRIGKKAVHLGGATQLLFGVKGKRWESHEFFVELINEHWVRPTASEVPADFARHENGCYW